MVVAKDVVERRHRASQHLLSGLAADWCDRKGITHPGGILIGKKRLGFGAMKPFPAPVIDLTPTITGNRRQPMRPRYDRRRRDRANHRAAVDGGDWLVGQTLSQLSGLGFSLGISGTSVDPAKRSAANARRPMP